MAKFYVINRSHWRYIMTVYVVLRHFEDWSLVYEQWMNEGHDVSVVGVYASREAAEKVADPTRRENGKARYVWDEIVEKEVQED